MKLNAANRSFTALLFAGACAAFVIGVAAVLVLSLVVYQAAGGGARTIAWFRSHDLLPLLAFLVPVAAGTIAATVSLRRQLRATRRLRSRVRGLLVPADDRVRRAAVRTRLRGRIAVVAHPEPFSFAYGLLWPRIVVSTGLVVVTTPEELEAVLEHERYHIRNLDPLKVVVARVLPSALFFLPVLRELRRRYVAGRELAADRRAAEVCGTRALAGALYKVAGGPAWKEMSAAAAIGGTDLLEARVTQLETGAEPEVPGVSTLSALATAVSVLLLVYAFAATLGDVGGPIGRTLATIVPGAARGPFRLAVDMAQLACWVVLGRFVYRRLTGRQTRT